MRKLTIRLISLLIGICLFSSGFCGDEDKVPFDPMFKHGQLKNGFTYYILKNQLPPERVYMYLLVNTGSMNEIPEQNGLAHFCEHMAFNGTKNFPDHSLKDYLESYGMSFGGGFNAYTSYDRTVYMLNKIPTTNEKLVDSCLLIMYDWAGQILNTTEEIDKERGVIHEEWRVRGGAYRRMSDKTNPILYNGGRYAEHNVIGKIEVIDECDPELLRQFYADWYRPDNQALVVVGDVDEEEMKRKIEKLFGKLDRPKNSMRKVNYDVPENEGMKVAIATDKEASNISISYFTRHPKPEKYDLNTLKEGMVRNLYFRMLSSRYNELKTRADPPFSSAYSYYGGFSEHLNSFTTRIYPLKEEPLRGLEAAIKELKRVKKYGFTESELERAKKSVLSGYEKQYKDRNKRNSSRLGQGCFGHFLDGHLSPGLEYKYNLANEYVPKITIEQVNNLNLKFFKDDFQALILHGPENDSIEIPSEQDLRNAIANAKNSDIKPYVDEVTDAPLVPVEPVPGKQITTEYHDPIDGTVWKLSNGAKVVWKYTDNKDDEILLKAFSPGGSSHVKTTDLPSSAVMRSAISYGGLGEFSKIQLQKKLTGKQAWMNPWMSGNEEGFYGGSSIKDVETMFQLLYLYFTAPRKDPEPFTGYMKRWISSIENRQASPSTAFYDTIKRVTTNYHTRQQIFNKEYLERSSLDKAMAIYSDRYQNAADFTFIIVGNIDTLAMKPLVEKYIGGLPSINRFEQPYDMGIRPPEGKVERHFTREMEEPKGYSFVQYWTYFPHSRTNSILTGALRYIISTRCTERVREEAGGTYGVGVRSSLSRFPYGIYKFSTQFNCDPDRVDSLTAIIYDLIQDIKENGPTDKEIHIAKEYYLKQKSENLKSNGHIIGAIQTYLKQGFYPFAKEYYEEKVEQITKDALQDIAGEIFAENRIEIIMVPPSEKDK